MKNKKIILIFIIFLSTLFLFKIQNKIFSKNIVSSKKYAIYVKGENSANYENQKNIPIGSYTLNKTKSGCENGGTVSDYDKVNGTVKFTLKGSSVCHLYFDYNDAPVINDVNISGKNVTATLSDDIDLCCYAITTTKDTPTSWTNVSGKTYSLNINLTSNGTYYLWVKDADGNIGAITLLDISTKANDLIFASDNVYQSSSNSSYKYIISDENGIRYEGIDPDNYVCLDEKESGTCESDKLYRIIGIFDENYSTDGTTIAGNKKLLKLIKSTSYGSYSWSGSFSLTTNDWSKSELNTKILNNTFINSLGVNFNNENYKDMIVTSQWHLGSPNTDLTEALYADDERLTPLGFYTSERSPYSTNNIYNFGKTDSNPTDVFAKVGLLYISDIGYSLWKDTAWSVSDVKESCNATAMYFYGDAIWADCRCGYLMGLSELTITPVMKNNTTIWVPTSDYSLRASTIVTTASIVRPTFYVNADVKITESSDGSINNPYRIY